MVLVDQTLESQLHSMDMDMVCKIPWHSRYALAQIIAPVLTHPNQLAALWLPVRMYIHRAC